MILFRLAWKSLLWRRVILILVSASLALSAALFCSIERIRSGLSMGFFGSISQTDLIVGARGSPIQLVLYTVFRMGEATNNISWESFEYWKNHPAVLWAVPFSLGDSHKGYRVVATDQQFFDVFRYQGDQTLKFRIGSTGSFGTFDVVLGSEVAAALGYKLADQIVIAHGLSEGLSLIEHSDKPFKVVGILTETGTPVDKSLYISLRGMEAIHADWINGVPPTSDKAVPLESLLNSDLTPKTVTSFMLRLKSRPAILHLQRAVQNYAGEPLQAVIPGVALSELWSLLSYVEKALFVMSGLVFLTGLLGMIVALLTTSWMRLRELAILRAQGASRGQILTLLGLESVLLGFIGVSSGILLSAAILYSLRGVLFRKVGVLLETVWPYTVVEWGILLALWIGCILAGVLPALVTYRRSVHSFFKT